MRNLLVEIAYNGSAYHGFQVQENALTVEEVVQDAIERIVGKRESIIGCSRTDAGVHANSYFFNMHTENPIECDRFVAAMNHHLPHDIAAVSCKEVDGQFHARYDAKEKEYVYKILNSSVKNPFMHELLFQYKYPIDVEKLDRAAKHFLGTHDFAAFRKEDTKERDSVRTIYKSEVSRDGDIITFTVCGNGFLYNMVRIMVGTLIGVAQGKIDENEIPEIIESRDRTRAGITAPPCGLYLNRVKY